ncbi:MAG: CRISPR-associated protein Csb2 [Nitrospira sp.]|nr:MAG: CRISPR-associated protein Csb2 [Nitrospira sp.]
MFGLGIDYLNGWAMAAADGPKKERAEWPPHPDRVFMALAAAWFETDQDAAEGDAIRWLEQLKPPGIAASETEFRDVVTSYVPANDVELAGRKKLDGVLANPQSSLKDLKAAGLTLAAEFRPRQERSFPVAIPHDPIVHLIWNEDLPNVHREPLTRLCGKVVSIGHSASFVQMWLTDSPPVPTLVVRDGVTRQRLRVFKQGRLDYLSRTCGRKSHITRVDDLWTQEQAATGAPRNKLKKSRETYLYGIVERLRPNPWDYAGYDKPLAEPAKKIQGSIFDPRLVILSLSGKRLLLPATLRLTEALRGALMAGTQSPLPEWLSGHALDGGRSEQPHVAFIPLPFVGREHADGRLLGVALALPRSVSQPEAAHVLRHWLRNESELPRHHRLFDGKWFECAVELETGESPSWSLRPEIWTGPARAWASVTPVVLDRHFDGKDKWNRAAENTKDACERVGLPRPQEVLLHTVSMFEGVPRSTDFPCLIRKKDGGRMHHAHAVIVFEEDVEGPVLVGAGRYRGYGLCRPLLQGDGDHA